jgi:hypothetical protein
MPKISCSTDTSVTVAFFEERKRNEESLHLMLNAQRNENCISFRVVPFVFDTQQTEATPPPPFFFEWKTEALHTSGPVSPWQSR